MAAVKKAKEAIFPPAISDQDMYHLADILDATIVQSNHKLDIHRITSKRLIISGIEVKTGPLSIDGVVDKDYAALDLFMGGDLHILILLMTSKTITNFTTLWISETPPEPLRSAFKRHSDPLPLRNFLDYLEGNTKRGFYTDAGKRWRELPEAAHMDLFKRGYIDANFSALLKV
jgi:hypothetical protein